MGLADLAGYRAALSGRPTADDAGATDPPARVRFRDLWNRPDRHRGRRVVVRGRVERIFRQGAVGDFPPLAEVWVASPAGDPFCLVFPQVGAGSDPPKDGEIPTHAEPRAASSVPEPGRTVRFTGTFLKMVRYASADGARLAPLIVGDRQPIPAPAEAEDEADRGESVTSPTGAGDGLGRGTGFERRSWSPTRWALGLVLAVLAAGVLARRHLRRPPRRAACRDQGRGMPDLPLEFTEPRHEPRP